MKSSKRFIKEYVKAIVLMAFCVFSTMMLYAQQQADLYRYSEKEVDESVKAVAKSYGKNDLEKQDRYSKVISKAFLRYWKLPKAQAPVGPNSIADLRAEADSLSKVLSAKGNPQTQRDSLSVLLAEYMALNDTVKKQSQQLKAKQNEIADFDNEISQIDSKLNQVKERLDNFSKAQDSLKLVADNLLNVYKKAQSKDDFSAVDIPEIDNAINQYISARRQIEAFKISYVKQLDNAVKGLETLSSLKLLVDDALGAMGAKFTPSRNQALIEDIRIVAAKTGPTPKQKDMLVSIVTSLQNQGAAVDNFLSILTALPEAFYCIPDEQSRSTLHVDKFIKDKVKEFNSASSSSYAASSSLSTPSSYMETYDKRYVQLNETLAQLIADLSAGSKLPITKINDNDKFQSYLKSIAKKVK